MTAPLIDERRAGANRRAVQQLLEADPVVTDVRPAGEVIPGMGPRTILTSGAPLPWDAYTGGQRRGIIAGALFEGLATDEVDAVSQLAAGDIEIRPCHEHGTVGSMAGIYTASIPVFVVENRAHGNLAYCSVYEGPYRERLTYGVYNETVRTNLAFVRDIVAPTLSAAIRAAGGVALSTTVRRALRMGDELHSRNTAATLLFTRDLLPHLLSRHRDEADAVEATLDFLSRSDLFFLHLGMAAAKAAADAADGVPGSSVVTAMTLSGREFSIRVSGLPGRWFRAPIPAVDARYFEGFGPDDATYIGGESLINETVGLGGLSAAAAFALRDYSGGTTEQMVSRNEDMYRITLAEHPQYRIPFLDRGAPVGIDVVLVTEAGITPNIHMGVAHKDGGHIGAGILTPPIGPFQEAAAALREEPVPGRTS